MNRGQAVHDRWKQLGLEMLLPEERDYVVLWWLMAEVNNGGFHQYFFNSTGDSAPLAIEALGKIGALETLDNLQRAMAVVSGEGPFIKEWEPRRQVVRDIPPARFDALDEEFYAGSEDFIEMALDEIDNAHARSRTVV